MVASALLTPISSPRPHHNHTELEEELHETAHIDYDRVAIVRQDNRTCFFFFVFFFINLTSLMCTDPQPLSSRSLRRCSRLRDGFRHHLERCPDCLLRKEDWPLTSRQANRPGAVIRKRHLVGSSQQAHEHRGKLRCARSCFCRLFLCRACRGNAVSPEGRMCEPRPQTSMHDSAARTVHNVQCTLFFFRLRCPTFWRSS